MPKKTRDESSDSHSDSDSGPEDRNPVKKSRKVEETKGSAKSSKKEDKSSDDVTSWEVGRNRTVKLTEFKGKWYVDIRETYLDSSGVEKPTKKGIMLKMEEWQKFKTAVPEIEAAIKKHV